MSDAKNTYICIDTWGHCKACGKYDDLRYGSCFDCADFIVTDEKKAWDIRNPKKKWDVVQ